MFRALRVLAGVQEARLASARELSWPLSGWLVPLECTTKTPSTSCCVAQKSFSTVEILNQDPWGRKPMMSIEKEAGERVFWKQGSGSTKAQRCLCGGPHSSGRTDSKMESKSDKGSPDTMGGIGKSNEEIDGQESGEKTNPHAFDRHTQKTPHHTVVMNQLQRRKEELKGFATKLSDLPGGKGVSEQPIIIYSSSWFWEDSMIGKILRALMKTMTYFQISTVQRFLDETFNEHDFFEGCKDANYMVNQLCGESDWDTLSHMVSNRLLQALREVGDEFKQKGLCYSMTTEHVRDIYVQGVHIIDKPNLEKFDSSLAANVTKSGAEDNYWMMIAVRMLSKERFKVWKKNEEIVSDTLHQRNDVWTFVRGPFQDLPLDTDDTDDLPWTLISIG